MLKIRRDIIERCDEVIVVLVVRFVNGLEMLDFNLNVMLV